MPNRGRRFPMGIARRKAVWANPMARTEVQLLATTTSIGDTAIGLAANEEFTLVRVRGEAFCHIVGAAASDSIIVGLGLTVVTAQAFAAGAASLPSPTDDLEQN